MWVRSLGLEATLEKDTATHSRILAWKIPWTEEPKESDTTELACRGIGRCLFRAVMEEKESSRVGRRQRVV